MFNFFKTPTIKARLIHKGTKAKVSFRNINKTDVVVLLFSVVKQTAQMLKIDHRQLMHKLILLDKQIVKSHKEEVRAEKYNRK